MGPLAIDFCTFFGISCVPSHTVREELLGWHGTIVGKACKEDLVSCPVVYILDSLEGEQLNRI